MVEKFKEKFRALIEDYKVTKNDNEDFIWWYVQRVAPFNLRYVIARFMDHCRYDYHRRKSLSKTKTKIEEPKESSLRQVLFFTYPQEEISGAISEELFENQREQDYNLSVDIK